MDNDTVSENMQFLNFCPNLTPSSFAVKERRSTSGAMATFEELTSRNIENCFNEKHRHRRLLGHQARTFDFQFHPTENCALSASEDGTARIWDLDTGRCIKSLDGHSKKHEVLRTCWAPPEAAASSVMVATGSADGTVRLWGIPPPRNDSAPEKGGKTSLLSRCAALTVVGQLRHRDQAKGLDGQVYSCQFVTDNGGAAATGATSGAPSSSSSSSASYGGLRLLTASDCSVHLWDVETRKRIASQALSKVGNYSIGGKRNPADLCYVFDAKPRPGSGSSTLAVALSDGTVRVGDILGGSEQTIALRRESSANTHLTGLNWSEDGLVLASCGGDGTVTVWDARMWTPRAVLRGHSRPVYGACFFPSTAGRGGEEPAEDNTPQLLLSWSSDETLCAWDAARACGVETRPLVTLSVEEGFPIYHCSVSMDGRRLAMAGGGGGGTSFVGVPIKVVELNQPDDAAAVDVGR